MPGSTRVTAPLQSGGDPIVSQVGGLDLIRRTRNELLGRENAIVDQAPNDVIGDTQLHGDLAHCQPFAIFLRGAVSGNVVDPAE